MIKLTIDGKIIEVPEGTTVLRAAEQAGVFIPTLCDHPELTPYGGCRLCLVEVEGFRTLQPSCTMPASNNMVIKTDTEKVHAARKLVLSLIFSERNHFCPYCQVSGGDCELQNNAYLEGMTHWPIQPNWLPYEVDASHPYIILEHNRCILCRRCVRACGELVGNFTLGFAERGAASILVADIGVPLGESTCVSCGMCVQVCPTGAIIDRSSAYQGLEKDVEKKKTICQACSVGCGLNVLVRDNRIVRIEGDWNAPINKGLTCERGRYQPLYDTRKRISTPLIRKSGNLVPVTWEEAITETVRILGKTASGIVSTKLSIESIHALKQIFGSKLTTLEHISTLPDSDFPEGEISTLDGADCFILVGADLEINHQVAGFMVKRAVMSGASLVIVDSQKNSFQPIAAECLISNNIVSTLQGLTAGLVKLGLEKGNFTIKPWDILGAIETKTGLESERILSAAEIIGKSSRPVMICGNNLRISSPEDLNMLKELVSVTGIITNEFTSLLTTKGEANSKISSVLGLQSAVKKSGPCFFAIGDSDVSSEMISTISETQPLVVQASYFSELTELADVILPSATWAEESGHFISLDGKLQQSSLLVKPSGQAKSNLAILSDLALHLGISLTEDWHNYIHGQKSSTLLKQ